MCKNIINFIYINMGTDTYKLKDFEDDCDYLIIKEINNKYSDKIFLNKVIYNRLKNKLKSYNKDYNNVFLKKIFNLFKKRGS